MTIERVALDYVGLWHSICMSIEKQQKKIRTHDHNKNRTFIIPLIQIEIDK